MSQGKWRKEYIPKEHNKTSGIDFNETVTDFPDKRIQNNAYNEVHQGQENSVWTN